MAERQALEDFLNYVHSFNRRKQLKGAPPAGALSGTIAAHVVALSVLAYWLGVLESFPMDIQATMSDELALLFIDEKAKTTSERLRANWRNMVFILTLLKALWEDSSCTIVADIEKDSIHLLGELLDAAQNLPALLVKESLPLFGQARYETPTFGRCQYQHLSST